jgi:hypothetical protein
VDIQIGEWESIETGKRATVVKVDESCVWYEIPEFTGLSPCRRDVWLASSRPVLSSDAA